MVALIYIGCFLNMMSLKLLAISMNPTNRKAESKLDIGSNRDYNTMSSIFYAKISDDEQIAWGELIKKMVMEKVADAIANEYIEKNFAEIMGKISPEAIANMAIAEAGAKINETLNKKMPDKIIEIEKRSTEIYQRGIFGGMKRI